MDNIVKDALQKISIVLADSGVEMDTWRTDAINMILVLEFNRSFQEGRRQGLKEAIGLFNPN